MSAKRKVVVTNHAVEAYRRRHNDQRSIKEIRIDIQQCVASGLESGYVFDQRPTAFMLRGRTNTSLPPGQRFVQRDPEDEYGFIVKRTPDEGDIVVTALFRVAPL